MTSGATSMTALSLNDRKELLSRASVLAVAAQAGFACENNFTDKGRAIDVTIRQEGSAPHQEYRPDGEVHLQLKATSKYSFNTDTECLKFPLRKATYDRLRLPNLIDHYLVVMLVPDDSEAWVEPADDGISVRKCFYWCDLYGLAASTQTGNEERVTIEQSNVLTHGRLTEWIRQASDPEHWISKVEDAKAKMLRDAREYTI